MNSLTSKVRFIGIFTSILLSIMAYLALEFVINYSKAREITNSILLYKILKQELHSKGINSNLQNRHLLEISEAQAFLIIKKASYLIETPIYREVFQSGDIGIYVYEDYYYYSFLINQKSYYFKNLIKVDSYVFYTLLMIGVLLILVFSLNYYLIKAMKPLKNLQKRIRSLALTQEVPKSSELSNLNEIEELSLAFDEAEERIHSLEEMKTLFWRNIMHELKTPLTQGKLMVHLLKIDEESKEGLSQVFDRMQFQLDKLKELEHLNSDNLLFKTSPCFLVDIIEGIEEAIQSENISFLALNKAYLINFELFGVGLKNIVCNALAYSSNAKVKIVEKENHLYIINKGIPLSAEFETYTQAFSRGNTQKNGMGLGLYISKTIFSKHTIPMKHRYLQGHHLIILDMRSVKLSKI